MFCICSMLYVHVFALCIKSKDFSPDKNWFLPTEGSITPIGNGVIVQTVFRGAFPLVGEARNWTGG